VRAQAAAAALQASQTKAAQLKSAQANQAAKARAATVAKAADAKAAQAVQVADAARAAAADHAQDQKSRAQREAELRRQLDDEEKVAALQAGPLQKSYIASIQNRITRAWLKPASARSGIVCSIEVTQVPGGEVTQVHVTNCNGDEAVRQSIENAVYRASPLPEPPDPALFQRNLTLVFKPNE
jgi:colicin import membrane protein